MEAKNANGFIPFVNAVKSGKEDVVRFCLDPGINKDATNNAGKIALTIVDEASHIVVYMVLLNFPQVISIGVPPQPLWQHSPQPHQYSTHTLS
jgi:ankyrin repeat protein